MKNLIGEAVEKIKRERLLEYIGINEGLICTYPIDKVVSILCRKYNINSENFKVEEYDDGKSVSRILTITLPLNLGTNNIGNIKHLLNTCGYNNIDKNNGIINGANIILTYEEKFPKEITNVVKNNIGMLYHSTPSMTVPKILKNGLVPKSKNYMFDYPDRVYFFHGFTLSDEQIITVANVQFSQFQHSCGRINNFSLLTIDPSKLPDNIKLYTDAVSNGGLFTYDNIPPSAIVSVKTFNPYKMLIENR